jgi:predicted amidophosphoribosyltransferase
MTNPNELRWREADESIVLAHCPDELKPDLLYARIYTVGRDFRFSETNNQIFNLKMSPNVSPQRLRYKQRACRQMAGEVIALLQEHLPLEQLLTLVPMPPSKARSHPEYDDRLEQVAQMIAARFDNVDWLPLLYTTESIESYHLRAGSRDPGQLYELMQVDVAQGRHFQAGSTIALLDDVLTSGAHFTAARRRLLEAFPEAEVIGIFWAKAVSPEDFL